MKTQTPPPHLPHSVSLGEIEKKKLYGMLAIIIGNEIIHKELKSS